jgi:hypothetical protein
VKEYLVSAHIKVELTRIEGHRSLTIITGHVKVWVEAENKTIAKMALHTIIGEQFPKTLYDLSNVEVFVEAVE